MTRPRDRLKRIDPRIRRAAVRSAPGRNRAEAGLIGSLDEKASAADGPCGSGGARGARRNSPQEIGELDGQLDPFTDLVGACGVMGGALQLAELGKQAFEALGQEPLAEIGVLAGPREIGVGDQGKFMHVRISRLFAPQPEPVGPKQPKPDGRP
jgi:hypothetical protein